MAMQQLIVLVLTLAGMAAAGPTFPIGIMYPSASSGTATLETTCELVKLDDAMRAQLSCDPLPLGVPAGSMLTIDPTEVYFNDDASTAGQLSGRKLLQPPPTPPGTPCPVGFIYIPPGLDIYLAGLNLNITRALEIQLSGYTQGGILGTLVCALASSPQAPANQTVATVNRVLADPSANVTVTNATATNSTNT